MGDARERMQQYAPKLLANRRGDDLLELAVEVGNASLKVKLGYPCDQH
jgi:hypothetical protein